MYCNLLLLKEQMWDAACGKIVSTSDDCSIDDDDDDVGDDINDNVMENRDVE